MKKSILVLVCLALTIPLFAQNEKGSRLAGVGFGGFQYTNSDSKTSYSNTPTVYNTDGNSFSISVYPSIAWFIKDNLAVGGSVNFGFYTSDSKSSNTGSSTTTDSKSNQPSVYIGPYARYYFGGSKTGMPFAQVNFQYGIYGGKSKSTSSGGSSSETTTKPKGDWSTGLQFGYEHFVNQHLGFYASVGFYYNKAKTTYKYRPSSGTGYDYTSDYSRFYIPVNIGLQVHLASKTKK